MRMERVRLPTNSVHELPGFQPIISICAILFVILNTFRHIKYFCRGLFRILLDYEGWSHSHDRHQHPHDPSVKKYFTKAEI